MLPCKLLSHKELEILVTEVTRLVTHLTCLVVYTYRKCVTMLPENLSSPLGKIKNGCSFVYEY